jgi:uncharacterized surface anchored protein
MRCLLAVLVLGRLAAQQTAGSGPQPDDKCSIEGTVVNAMTGEPLKKAHLTLQPADRPNGAPYGTDTDAGGHFLMDKLDPGNYSLSADRNGFLAEGYSPDGNPRHRIQLKLAVEQNLKDVVFKLMPQGVITGRVIDEDGEPLVSVSVQLLMFQYQGGKRQLEPGGATFTDDLGEFRLHHLRSGKYLISASWNARRSYSGRQERIVGYARDTHPAEEEYVTTYYPSATSPNAAIEVEVTPGAQIGGINIALARMATASISGHVNLPQSNSQSYLAQVTLTPKNTTVFLPQPPYSTDAQGNFEMRGVQPGSYWLSATFGADLSAHVPLEVGNAKIEGLELTLQPVMELTGHVVVEGEVQLPDGELAVWFQAKHAQYGAKAEMNKDLTFRVPKLQRDDYDIFVNGLQQDFYLKSIRAGQQGVADTGIDLASGAPEDLAVTINPNGGVVEGTVQNAKDEPAAGAWVTLIPDANSAPRLFKLADTDQNGHFTLHGVAPGDYKIFAWEDVEAGAYQDPDFVKPHESAGQALSIRERAHENVQLKLIPAEDSADAPAGR